MEHPAHEDTVAGQPVPATEAPQYDWSSVREKLAGETGQRFWRSLEELADDEEFLKYVRAEFPEPAALMDSGLNRRSFLKLMGASLALAGLNACTKQPEERIFPYVDQPEQLVPGRPLFYATAFPHAGAAIGVLAESHLGRPTKLEGNTVHPASLGATDPIAQASVLQLYDPDRAQVITRGDEILPWPSLTNALGEVMKRYAAPSNGGGLRFLTPAVTSPTFAAQMRRVLKRFPQARWHRWEAVNRDNSRRGTTLAFDEIVDVRYDLSAADVIVALDADFLGSWPGGVRYAREFARGRSLEGERTHMSRLYAIESSPTLTGAKADHRLALTPDDIERLTLRLAAQFGLNVRRDDAPAGLEPWILALARDLDRVRGRSLVIAGEAASPAIHALAAWLNETLGNVGKTVEYIEPVEADAVVHTESLAALVEDMRARKVSTLVIFGGNPVYDAPADLDFAGALRNVEVAFRHGLYDDETAHLCHWQIPDAHWLETWGDVRTFDGTATIQQPIILPLYSGKSASELLAVIGGEEQTDAYEIVRSTWKERNPDGFEDRWRTAVRDGIVEGTASPVRRPALRDDVGARVERMRAARPARKAAPGEGTEIVVAFRPDQHVWDGSFANNAWLQELPRAHTKLVWDNAALVAPKLAERLGLKNGDVVEISSGERFVLAPVWITPGHADGVITLPLGYGRTQAGKVGNGLGFNAYRLRTSDALWHLPAARVRKTGTRSALVTTQDHWSMEGRPIVRTATLEEYRREPGFAREHADEHKPASMYPDYTYDGYAWGMTIDLNACIGCNACTIACQAENNIAVVGKEQVARGREMHWIRVDRYFEGDIDNPAVHFQPVPCMHCEQAPCEVVCPVNATVHSKEGLNDMVYNRCVGTRYCSNNCPYKVRRFNFLLYSDWYTETFKLQRNPDVTVRSRGVMEKCSYCVQRISHGRIAAKEEGRSIRDGEVVTACQQVCPAEAITFGDINDANAKVTKLKADERNYGLLADLGTRPRTTYLASVRNPNPEIVKLEGQA